MPPKMMIKSNPGVFQNLLPDRNVKNNSVEICWNLPKEVGNGSFRKSNLRAGLELFITDFELDKPMVARRESNRPLLGLDFFLKGNMIVSSREITGEHLFESGSCNFYRLPPEHVLFCETKAKDKITAISIHLDPKVFYSFVKKEQDKLPSPLNQVFKGNKLSNYFDRRPITLPLLDTLQQILQCPYHGLIRKMFMESKAFELLVLYLNSCLAVPTLNQTSRKMWPEDRLKVRQVKKYVTDNLENPPTLSELSRIVGLSHPKLNSCFQSVYGTTVFEFIRQTRLMNAKLLLEKGDMNVTEVAYSVGYSSLSHFSKAFKQRFGMLPGCYLRNG